MITIHEWSMDDGTLATVALGVAANDLLVLRVGNDAPVTFDPRVLERVMGRYGKPLADDVPLDGPVLDLGAGRSLRHIRYLARFDVIARDYLVWSTPTSEPLAELAVTISGALVHLVRAAATREEG